ncbi:MAG: hypothetical protein U9P38_00640 [Campylobacterota bacterium]|nr:hypothetical protein [Campylobacterota bacterium]
MKNILLILLVTNILFGNSNYELKLYEKLLPTIFSKTKLLIYTDRHSEQILKHSNVLNVTQNCEEADLLMGKRFINLDERCKNKPLFATSYLSYHNSENSFGAFYWRKGRPQILFNHDLLQHFNLYLPDSLKKYAQ